VVVEYGDVVELDVDEREFEVNVRSLGDDEELDVIDVAENVGVLWEGPPGRMTRIAAPNITTIAIATRATMPFSIAARCCKTNPSPVAD
jgi:hypothetical protein